MDINSNFSKEKYLVAVSDSPSSEYLLEKAIAIAQKDNAALIVLHVQKPKKMLARVSSRLIKYYELAIRQGAEIVTAIDDKIIKGILRTAEEKKVTHIIIGETCRGGIALLLGNQPVRELLHKNSRYRITVISDPVLSPQGKKHLLPIISYRIPFSEYGLGLLGVFIMTLLNLVLVRFVGYWSIALLYLLFISCIALFIRVGPVLSAAFLSALLWNFLFIPPKYTLTIGRIEDVLMLVIYFANAVIIGTLTSKLRLNKQIIEKSEKKISVLYAISRELGNARNLDEIAALAVKSIKEYVNIDSVFFFEDAARKQSFVQYPSDAMPCTHAEFDAALWAFVNKKPAGLNADIFQGIDYHFTPLLSGGKTIGVFGIKSMDMSMPGFEGKNFLNNIIYLICTALERDMYIRFRQEAMLHTESERLYKVLFSLVSHELKTPLTTIKGASTSLIDEAVDMIPKTRHGLYFEIKKASDRINRLFENLLSMSRIESGHLALEIKPHDIHDLLSISLKNLGPEMAGHKLIADIPADIPAVYFDFFLMEQVIVNLVHNACVHTQADSIIIITASAFEKEMMLSVKDNGPGFTEDEIPHLFEKFKKNPQKGRGGIGLGLSICKGIIEAHGGRIIGTHNQPNGAVFEIRLPMQHARREE